MTLELHGQNTLVAMGADGRPAAVICREVAGGAYCFEPLLLANGHDLRPSLHARQDAVFEDAELPLRVLQHATFCQHLLPLAEAVASLVPGLAHSDLVRGLRDAVAATLAACSDEHPPRLLRGEAHRAAFHDNLARTRHALLAAPTVRAKSLLLMRALGSKLELFSEAHNPLIVTEEDAEAVSGHHANGNGANLGRLASFPLAWRG